MFNYLRVSFLLFMLLFPLVIIGCGGGEDEGSNSQQSQPIIQQSNATATTNPTTQYILSRLTLTAQSSIVFRTTPAILGTPITPLGQTNATPTTESSINFPALRPENCPIPIGWFPYTIAQGDSLSYIAVVIGTTVEIIQTNNCLENPDGIFAGDVIYLPQLPPSVTPSIPTPSLAPTLTVPVANPIVSTPSPTTGFIQPSGQAPRFVQSLVARPTQLRADGAYVTAQATIELDSGVVADAIRVRYLAGTSISDSNPVQIGVITDPYISTRYTYTFSAFDKELYFRAIAENEFGTTQSNIVHVVYDSSIAGQTGGIKIQPFEGYDTNTQIYTLTPNNIVILFWESPPTNTISITFYVKPLSANVTVIGTDVNAGDGFYVGWTVPANLRAEIYAEATLADGSKVVSDKILTYSEAN